MKAGIIESYKVLMIAVVVVTIIEAFGLQRTYNNRERTHAVWQKAHASRP
jgi:hypothetical protein